jgi:hypothetical protein
MTAPTRAPGLHLGASHPLATLAAARCEHVTPLVGGVACGACWEQAIRDDERFVVENDLPGELVTDPDLVDEVAVERAMGGRRVQLTSAERRTAIAALLGRGMTPGRISTLLGLNHSMVTREARDLLSTAA